MIRRLAALSVVVVACVAAVVSVEGQGQSVLGEWSPVFPMPLVATHAALMNTGRVLVFDALETPGTPSARLWDPASGQFTAVPNTFAKLYCSGHILTADGRLLTAGGHNGIGIGVNDATVFNPATLQWTALPNLNASRWCPSVIQLADGRAVALGGAINRPVIAEVPEALSLGGASWTPFSAAQKNAGERPHAFQGPDGRIFVNALDATLQSWLLGLDGGSWTLVGQSAAPDGSTVMYQPGRFMMSGGTTLGAAPVRAATAVIDLNAATPIWRQAAAMVFGRTHHNLVILPDGKVLAVGGSTEVTLTSPNGVLPAEIWDPDTEAWTQVASMARPRMYNSVALLLPDGRVLAAGGGRVGPDELSGQLYSPGYLFSGARPIVTAIPGSVGYGNGFSVSTPTPAAVARVTLIRNSSVTKATNLDQRFFELSFARVPGGLTVQAPADARTAPAGDYMLFVLDANGVPSVGRVLRLENAGGVPSLVIRDATATEGTAAGGSLVFDVARNGSLAGTVTVAYATSDGTATEGSDYTSATGTLTFPPGTSSRTIVIPIIPDAAIEPNETVRVTLSNPSAATIADGVATGTIVNDDGASLPALSISSTSVNEGSSGAVAIAEFTVTLSPSSAQSVTVGYRTRSGTAVSPADFANTTGALTFVAGTMAQTIQVPIVPDLVVEPNERFTVELFNPTSAQIAGGVGTGTIRNDDAGTVSATFVVSGGADDVNEDGVNFEPGLPTVWAGTGASTSASYLGLRFSGITIPAGARVQAAKLQGDALTQQFVNIAYQVAAEASANSEPFSAGSKPSQRALLPPRALHTSDILWPAASRNDMVDVRELVQAVVDQAGWDGGQALSFILQGTGAPFGRKFVASSETGLASAPRLVVTFTVDAPTVPPAAPEGLVGAVSGNTVSFSWLPPSFFGPPVVGYVIDAGYGPGQTAASLPVGNVQSFAVAAPDGVFYVRVRAQTIAGFGPPSNEVRVTTGQAAPPLAPKALLATVQGNVVSFQWSHDLAGPSVAGFQVQAGYSSGATDVGVAPFAADVRSFSVAAPAATYYVRVVAVNAAGASPPSNVAVVSPGPGICTTPETPTNLLAIGGPSAIVVQWNPASAGAIPTGYQLFAGSVSGAVDLGSVALPPTPNSIGGAIRAGQYFLRLAALNNCGSSALSSEFSVVVP